MKLIPGTDNFYATENGQIFNEHGVPRNITKNGDGYLTANIRIKGKWITFGVQRLVAFAFLMDTWSNERNYVNHIDGNIENNHVSNLEWVTVKENNVHAAIFRGCPKKPTLILQSPRGVDSFSSSKEHACGLIECTFPELWNAVKTSSLINGWAVRYNLGPKPESLRIKLDVIDNRPCPIKFLNVDSGEITHHSSVAEAARHYGYLPSLIRQQLSDDGVARLCKKTHLVVREESDFPVITEKELIDLRKHASRSVAVGNLKTGKIELFGRAVDFYRKYNLSKKSVTTSLAVDRLREVGGFVYLYLNSDNIRRIKDFMSQSSGTEV